MGDLNGKALFEEGVWRTRYCIGGKEKEEEGNGVIWMGEKFKRLERKIERSERKAHPNYSAKRVKYIADATAGQIARKRRMAVA